MLEYIQSRWQGTAIIWICGLCYTPHKAWVRVRKQIFDCLLLYAMTHALVLEPIQMLLKYCIYTEHYLWIFKDASFNILVRVSK